MIVRTSPITAPNVKRIASTLAAVSVGLLTSPPLRQRWRRPTRQTDQTDQQLPAGRPSDFLARTVGEHITASSKQPVITDNRAGAGGNVAPMWWPKPCGWLHRPVRHRHHAHRQSASIRHDAVQAGRSGAGHHHGLVRAAAGVHPGTGFKSLKDFDRRSPEKPLSFSSGGSGSPGHLAGAVQRGNRRQRAARAYKGNTPAVTAVLSGEVEGGVLATPGMLPHVKAGKITPLAVTSRQRRVARRTCRPSANSASTTCSLRCSMPCGCPKARPGRGAVSAEAIADALNRPQVQSQFATLEMFFDGATGADAAKRLADSSARYARVIKKTGMKVD